MQQPLHAQEESWIRYYAILGKRAGKAMAEKAQKGDLPGCAPVGYRNVRDGKKSWIEVDEETAPLIRLAFELAAKGEHSLRKILQIVTDKGLRSRNGKQLGVSSLHTLLTNPFYTGRLWFRGELLPGNHQPIIDEFLFGEVQAALDRRRCRR
jgi:hypothetical protein